MRVLSRLHAWFAAPAAVITSLALAGNVAGGTWSGPVAITPDDVRVANACRSRNSALVAYASSFTFVAVKRSNNGGASWQREVKIADGNVLHPQIACRGRRVDVVWQHGYRLRYAHSDDGGRTFGSSRRLSPWQDDEVVDVDVARGPGGLVAVVWSDQNSDGFPDVTSRVRIRISHDGGQTFSATRTIAENGVGGSVAIGDGVVYVAYSADDSFAVRVRTSADGGMTWTAPLTVTSSAWDGPDVVAQGGEAYIGYSRRKNSDHWLVYRRTLDSGQTWSSPMELTSPGVKPAADLHLNFDGDLLQAAYVRCGDHLCHYSGKLVYRESTDGVDWTDADVLAGGPFFGNGDVGGVTWAERPIVVYTGSDSERSYGLSRFRMP